MYWINTMPKEAMARKGHISFPEDFARLRPGETFTAWRVRGGWEIETTLDGKALIERLMELGERINRERSQEFQHIVLFAGKVSFDTELACNKLRSLWTAYCLRHNLVVDTGTYDLALMDLWERVAAVESDTAYWSDYDSFDDFMCANLV